MPEVLVISGKGGTGKTSLTGAFAHLAQSKVICDLDVDAPDLHLLLRPRPRRTEEFYSGNLAVIAPERCTGCGECQARCRYGAVREKDGVYSIAPLGCEGCKVCVHFCPAQAIDFPVRHCGQWQVSDTRLGTLVHAQLFPGQENSGRLVALLRQQARELARAQGAELILSDGPPGIGCPVISSLSGTDLAVVVTEPTLSGIHDLERVAELCRHFRVPAAVIVNRYDLNLEHSQAIGRWCADNGLGLPARLPHDPAFTEAMVRQQTITEYKQSPLTDEIRRAWSQITSLAGLPKAA
ncbi:MAG: (4Fe-4S)-binding protein [Desulfarculus sp.]|nr:MAG: (4Fe-4S)-binding protein [Desulfarculus sp.]